MRKIATYRMKNAPIVIADNIPYLATVTLYETNSGGQFCAWGAPGPSGCVSGIHVDRNGKPYVFEGTLPMISRLKIAHGATI